MKIDTKTVLNKLIAYARDNLMLDALDETYTLNRLAALCGVKPEYKELECDQTLEELLTELESVVPGVDKAAAIDVILPLPHTVNYYFTDELDRNANKAFDFVFELYTEANESFRSNGYTFCADAASINRAVSLTVGNDELEYTPVNGGARIATLSCPDILSVDIAARMAAYADKYDGVIVKSKGDMNYLCADGTALSGAAVKEQIKTGAVKVATVDYPVPALKISGIAKNSVAREAASLIKAADAENLDFVTACTKSADGFEFYLVLAGNVEKDDLFVKSDALAACGVVTTADLKPVLSVLEKGTALSTDLFIFKPVYAIAGGVKHGSKAGSALADALVKLFKPILAKTASADEDKLKALCAATETTEA